MARRHSTTPPSSPPLPPPARPQGIWAKGAGGGASGSDSEGEGGGGGLDKERLRMYERSKLRWYYAVGAFCVFSSCLFVLLQGRHHFCALCSYLLVFSGRVRHLGRYLQAGHALLLCISR